MDALPIVWLLWTFSSAGSDAVGTFPNQVSCVEVQIQLKLMLDKPPRVALIDTMCLPTLSPSYRAPVAPHRYGM